MQDPSNSTGAPMARAAGHRRAHSEVNYRLPEDLDLGSDLFGDDEDMFSTYMDFDSLGSGLGGGSSDNNVNNRPRHRHSNSVDGSGAEGSIEAKKAMSPDKLAQLWTIDPKRAKRTVLKSALRIEKARFKA